MGGRRRRTSMPNGSAKKTSMPKNSGWNLIVHRFICKHKFLYLIHGQHHVCISSSGWSEHMNYQGNWKNSWPSRVTILCPWYRVAAKYVCLVARWRTSWSSVYVPATLIIWSIFAKYWALASFYIWRRRMHQAPGEGLSENLDDASYVGPGLTKSL